MRVHPYADRFPMLDQEELERLAADIAENGLQNPVILDEDGRILDGRNRWAACELAGVTPETVLYEGGDLAAFVLSQNVSRRHLTGSQQAMSTALVLVDAGRRENGRWKRGSIDIGESSNISAWRKAMDQAGKVLDHAADLAEAVVSGGMALDAALREAERRRDAERAQLEEQERIEAEEAAYREHLEREAPAYLDNHATARQAFAAWEDDNRREAARLRVEKVEAEREAKLQTEAATSLYGGMAEALSTLSGYGEYKTVDNLMVHFDKAQFNPRSLAAQFTPAALAKAKNFITMLEEWEASR